MGSDPTNQTPSVELDLLSDFTSGNSCDDFDAAGLIDSTFVREDPQGIPTRTTVVEVDEETGKILLEYSHGQHEWVQPNIVQEALLSREDEGAAVWSFKRVLSHKKEGNQIFVEILWDNNEVTWEPLSVMRRDDPITLAKYAKDQQIENKQGWKWSRKLNKNNKKMERMMRTLHAQKGNQKGKQGKKFKFGVEVPKNVKDALRLDQKNGNTKWKDAIKKELEQLMEFNTFKVLDPGETNPPDHTFIPLLMTFDVKFDGRYKARICANGSRTPNQVTMCTPALLGWTRYGWQCFLRLSTTYKSVPQTSPVPSCKHSARRRFIPELESNSAR